jgi:hypothetical protein
MYQKLNSLRKINFHIQVPTGKPVGSVDVAKFGTEGFSRRTTKKRG